MYKKTKHILHLAAILACAGVTLAPNQTLFELKGYMYCLDASPTITDVLSHRINAVNEHMEGANPEEQDAWTNFMTYILAIAQSLPSSTGEGFQNIHTISKALCAKEQKLPQGAAWRVDIGLMDLLGKIIDSKTIPDEAKSTLDVISNDLSALDQLHRDLTPGVAAVNAAYYSLLIEMAQILHSKSKSTESIPDILSNLKSKVIHWTTILHNVIQESPSFTDNDRKILTQTEACILSKIENDILHSLSKLCPEIAQSVSNRASSARSLVVSGPDPQHYKRAAWTSFINDISSVMQSGQSSTAEGSSMIPGISEAICKLEKALAMTKEIKLVDFLDSAIDGIGIPDVTNELLTYLRRELGKLDKSRDKLGHVYGMEAGYQPLYAEVGKLRHELFLSKHELSQMSIYQTLLDLKSETDGAMYNILNNLSRGEHLSKADKEILNRINDNIGYIEKSIRESRDKICDLPLQSDAEKQRREEIWEIYRSLRNNNYESKVGYLQDQLLLQIHDRDKINEQVKEIMSRFNAEFRKLEDLLLT